MTKGNDKAPVVYYFADPAFPWDIGPGLADLERRGFRVVKGDNADELLFLMQMGRPAAILYTIATPEARAHGSFQLVSRRALDMLVPLFAIGPDDPRDGVLLRYPRGGVSDDSHAPFHTLGDLIEQFDAEPPSTPSRPPLAVASQTFGKGRTMMSWRRDGPIVTPPNDLAPPTAPVPTVPPPRAAAEPPAADHEERKTLPTKRKHAAKDEAARDAAPTATPTISAISAPPAAPVREPVRAVHPAPEPAFAPPRPRPQRSQVWKIPAVIAAGVAIGVAALVVYLATAPGPADRPAKEAPPATALPRPAPMTRPAMVDTGADDGRTTAPERPAEVRPVAGGDEAGGAAPQRRRVNDEQSGEADEALLADASGTVRFPGHFRDASAIFWFAGDWEERRFIDLVRSLGPNAKIRVIGHSTEQELAAGLHNLALSRAWAVEKYLVRQGIADERIETEKGALVTSGADLDERGWPRNRWVDVRFD
jgi:hypothetical protein